MGERKLTKAQRALLERLSKEALFHTEVNRRVMERLYEAGYAARESQGGGTARLGVPFRITYTITDAGRFALEASK